jgi:hypothetical protein
MAEQVFFSASFKIGGLLGSGTNFKLQNVMLLVGKVFNANTESVTPYNSSAVDVFYRLRRVIMRSEVQV